MTSLPTDDLYPIHTLARTSNLSQLETLLPTYPKSLFKPDDDGRLPLHWSCTQPNADVTSFLLSSTPASKVDSIIDAQDSSGWSPLMIASSLPQDAGLAHLDLLLARDADVKVTSTTSGTALHFAVSKGNTDVVRRLLKAGASARMKDVRGQLPLHRAAAAGNMAMTKLLCDPTGKGGGASQLDIRDRDGLTPLHHAICEGHADVALELLRRGADSGLKDAEGRTALESAPDREVNNYILRRAELEGIEIFGAD